MKDKIHYVGGAKPFIVNGNLAFKINLCFSDLREAMNSGEVNDSIFTSDKSGRTYINLVAFPMKEESQSDSQTHSLKVDTYKPKVKEEKNKY